MLLKYQSKNKMASVLLSSEVSSDQIVFESPRSSKVGSGVKSINVGYIHTQNGENSDSQPGQLIIQTAKMRIPFGISNNEKFGDGKKWDMQVSFGGEREKKKIQLFRNAIQDIDDKVINHVSENSEEIFGKKMKKELLQESYKSGIKESKNPTRYADNFRIQIGMKKDDTPYAEFYDKSRNLIDWKEVQAGSEVIGLIQLTRIWSSTGTKQFGPTWKLIQLQVFRKQSISGYQIKEDTVESSESEDDEDEEVIESADELEN